MSQQTYLKNTSSSFEEYSKKALGNTNDIVAGIKKILLKNKINGR